MKSSPIGGFFCYVFYMKKKISFVASMVIDFDDYDDEYPCHDYYWYIIVPNSIDEITDINMFLAFQTKLTKQNIVGGIKCLLDIE